jgi:hypothetical protein
MNNVHSGFGTMFKTILIAVSKPLRCWLQAEALRIRQVRAEIAQDQQSRTFAKSFREFQALIERLEQHLPDNSQLAASFQTPSERRFS